METPTIIINGKEIEMQKPKARMWRVVMQFEDVRKNISTTEVVDEYCAIIATAFGVTSDEILDNLNLEDVFPTYMQVLKAVVKNLSDKLAKKNETAEEKI